MALLLAALPAAADESPAEPTPDRAAQPSAALQQSLDRDNVRIAAPVEPVWKRFHAAPFLITTWLGAGLEPHSFRCKETAVPPGGSTPQPGSVTCSVAAFSVGGALLWRGLVGPSLGLWASNGSPLVPNDETQLAIGDRISGTLGLHVRPLAYWAWNTSDSWLSRFAAGVGIEVGPSFEYLRTSGIPISECPDVPTNRMQGGFHAAGSVEIPILGDSRHGWLSLRATVRALVNSEAKLAPLDKMTCRPQVGMPAVNTQLTFGFAYSL